MATSGSYNYTISRNTIVKRAFNLINIYSPMDTVESGDQELALDLLNMMLKSWQAETRNQWNRQYASVLTAYQTANYSLSSTGSHCTKNLGDTTISSDEAAGQTVISVTSSSGMTASDNVGIELDDGTRQWTTIVSVDSSTQITITAALTGAAASGNTIFFYTNKIDRPLEIVTAMLQDITETNETKMEQLLFEEYHSLSDKTMTGRPSCFMYDPQLSTGTFYLWPVPDNVNYIVNITFQESFEDMDAQANNADIPQEWLLALIFNLAVLLCYPYGRIPELDKIQAKAMELKALALNYDNNNSSLLMSPRIRPGTRTA